MDPQVPPGWEGLRELCRILRAPNGCAWDRAQTVASLTPYLLEETHEVLEAIAARDDRRLQEEIGDLLFLLAFLITVAEADARFSFDRLAAATIEKMIRRHPHVFDQTAAGADARQAGEQWEHIKQTERRARGDAGGRLASGAERLPALLEAFRVQEKAAGLGFDWPQLAGVTDKLDEERDELARAIAASPDPRRDDAVLDEVGDLLFTLVNLARHLGADPEQLLKRTTRRFQERFGRMEMILTAEGARLGAADLASLERAWQRSKQTGA
jgi:MazG family protein